MNEMRKLMEKLDQIATEDSSVASNNSVSMRLNETESPKKVYVRNMNGPYRGRWFRVKDYMEPQFGPGNWGSARMTNGLSVYVPDEESWDKMSDRDLSDFYRGLKWRVGDNMRNAWPADWMTAKQHLPTAPNPYAKSNSDD